MSNTHYESDLSVNDCLAVLLGLDLDNIRMGEFDALLDELQAEYSFEKSRLEQSNDKEQTEWLEERVKEVADEYAKALSFHTRLVGEIAKARRGIDTIIVLTRDSHPPSYDYSQTYISRLSFIDWCKEELSIKISDEHLSICAAEQSDEDQPTASKFTANDEEKYQVIIALLLEELSERAGNLYSNAGKPNYTQIAEALSERARKSKLDPLGLSAQRLRKKFSEAQKTKSQSLSAGK